MKYNELHRLLKKAGCYEVNRQRSGHPLWYSPKTGRFFTTSNHYVEDVRPGTLKSILRDAGIN